MNIKLLNNIELRSGCTRIVLLVGNYAIKFPKPRIWNHFLKGLIANIEERRCYKWNSGAYEDGKSRLLVPTIFCFIGGWFVVARRAKQLTAEQFNNSDIFNHVKYFPGDDGFTNYGLYRNRIVKIDYGNLNQCPNCR